MNICKILKYSSVIKIEGVYKEKCWKLQIEAKFEKKYLISQLFNIDMQIALNIQ